jgi:dynein heavy chain
MPVLEKEVEKFREESGIHSQFRLILTSMPAAYFPVSVLQNGLKITTEPPRGIRANLKRNYGEFNEELLNESSKPEIWRKMLFGLCFFHSVVQERRKFGPLGFNIRYEFNDSDLDTSIKSLKMFLDENIEIPWDALTYITGHIHYGGRVTDDWDRTCLLSALRRFYAPDILDESYKFSSSGIYYSPEDGNLEYYRNYINSLPYDDSPEVFWLHENANITFQNQESERLLNDILSVQPRIASSGGRSNDDIVMETVANLSKSLPEALDASTGHSDLFIKVEYDLIPSLSTVLLQEIEKFNRLTSAIKRSLIDIQRAINGEVVMSEELDNMYMAILNSQVPNNWKKVAYPSLKPLASWIRDLKERVGFMSDWLKYGNPTCYWLSGFFYPQSFMTGILQTHSRRYGIPIDHLKFSFNVTDCNKDEIKAGAYDGVYIYGLILEGAVWDRDERQLADSHPKELYSVMPVIHFLPSGDYEQSANDYVCPVYKTSVRAGELSTTGQSTNFILAVDLPTDENPEFWTLRGTALLCQLND